MILILISIVVSVMAGAVLLIYANHSDGILSMVAGVLLCTTGGISAIAYSFTIWSWLAADTKAQIINREYGTHYTREDVFYASDVIDTIRQIDRKRIEVNGDIMRKDGR